MQHTSPLNSKLKTVTTPIDTLSEVETPEGVKLTLSAAGPFIRFLAYVIDLIIRYVVFIFISTFFVILRISGVWILLIIFFFLEWFYPVVFEVLNKGKTPGKMVFGIQVVMTNGTPLGWNASMLRNLLRAADCFLYSCIVGLVAMLCTKGFRRLGDLAAGTLVVYYKEAYNFYLAADWKSRLSSPPVPAATPLTINEQKAIVSFAGRLNILGKDRARELSTLIAPLVDQRPISAKDPLLSVISVASFLVGHTDSTVMKKKTI
ncbi:MAG: RDD family protein [Spirochaetales bacterium]|nr:RDD family protein [Spirochaetales bacterium]